MSAYISLKDVVKTYIVGDSTINACDGVTLDIDKGQFVIIVGPSGAGKTTVLNILGGMDTLTSGSITVDGTDISRLRPRALISYRREDVGFVFQFYNLMANLTALENVELALQICKEPMDAKVVLEEVGLAHRMNNFPAELSGGEQQRIAIARIMLKNAPIVILDEATAFTDPENEQLIQQSISELTKGKTLLVIAHRLSTVKDADKIVVLNEGIVEAEGTHEELLKASTLYEKMWSAHIGAKGWTLKGKEDKLNV